MRNHQPARRESDEVQDGWRDGRSRHAGRVSALKYRESFSGRTTQFVASVPRRTTRFVLSVRKRIAPFVLSAHRETTPFVLSVAAPHSRSMNSVLHSPFECVTARPSGRTEN